MTETNLHNGECSARLDYIHVQIDLALHSPQTYSSSRTSGGRVLSLVLSGDWALFALLVFRQQINTPFFDITGL